MGKSGGYDSGHVSYTFYAFDLYNFNTSEIHTHFSTPQLTGPTKTDCHQEMMKKVTILLALLGLAAAATQDAASQTDGPARLLVSKQLQNKFVVENMDVVIKYSIYNVGSTSATNVLLKDSSFGPDFKVVGGQPEVNYARISPSANVTHVLVVRPIKYGYYNFTAATITYKSGEEGTEVLQGWSSEPGEGYIAPIKEFDKRFSPHLLDWTAFAIMAVPPLVIPFMLWHSSKSKYEAVLLGKKSK